MSLPADSSLLKKTPSSGSPYSIAGLAKLGYRVYDPFRIFFYNFLENILKSGPIPEHLSFIMDGNRRYAKKKDLVTQEGHVRGFEKMIEMMEVCLRLGVKIVSVYAFSIDNFKRQKEEVDGLMDLARAKLSTLADSESIVRNKVKVRGLGNLSKLPKDVQQTLLQLEQKTASHDGAVLNICISYTSRYEMLNAVQKMGEKVDNGEMHAGEVSEEMFEKHLMEGTPPSVLVRSSGETRLSDYMLWQNSFVPLKFYDALWPEMSSLHIYYTVLMYQQQHNSLMAVRKEYSDLCASERQAGEHAHP